MSGCQRMPSQSVGKSADICKVVLRNWKGASCFAQCMANDMIVPIIISYGLRGISSNTSSMLAKQGRCQRNSGHSVISSRGSYYMVLPWSTVNGVKAGSLQPPCAQSVAHSTGGSNGSNESSSRFVTIMSKLAGLNSVSTLSASNGGSQTIMSLTALGEESWSCGRISADLFADPLARAALS